jgi:hypothetical protein
MDPLNEIARLEIDDLRRHVMSLRSQQRFQRRVSLAIIAASVGLWATTAISAPASPLTTVFPDLYQFSPNTPALAAEVNSNFATIRQLAADNQAALATKLDTSGGVVNGNLDVNGVLEVGTSLSASIRLFNDSDIVGINRLLGHNDLHLQGDGAGGTDVLIKADGEVDVKYNLRVQGTVLFNRQSCHTVTSSGTWNYCPDGEFVAGIDHDANLDRIGGVYCCKL